jgi:mxaA protein
MAKTAPIEGDLPSPACGRGAGVRAALLAVLTLLCALAHALQLDTIEPRPFGYTVGDVLERRLLVDRTRDGMVDPTSLPKPGRSGRWFQLRQVKPTPDGVRLDYQLVNVPPQPDLENLPSLTVRVIGPDGRARDGQIGPYTVAMAPVVHVGPNEVIQADNMRPDVNPKPIDISGRRQRVFWYAAALIALAAAQLAPALAQRLGWHQAGPFARARRALRWRRGRGDEATALSDALRRLHQAFDEATGGTLALDNVERLLLAHPWLAPARANVEAFLAESRAAFFGGAPPPTRARLNALAEQLADLERRQ